MTARRSILSALLLLASAGAWAQSVSFAPGNAAVVGTPYVGTIKVTLPGNVDATGSYTFTVSGTLPPGLSVTGMTISGTPTTVGSFPFIINAYQSGAFAGSDSVSITVGTSLPLSISTTSLPGGTVGATYSIGLVATGGIAPYSWKTPAGSTLPAGLALDPVSGAISGKPTTAGMANVTFQVTDSATSPATASRALSFVISASANGLTLNTSAVPSSGTINTAYAGTLSATGGTGPYTFSLPSGSTLPAGLALASSGAISGMPTAAGTTIVNFQVIDSANPAGNATASVSIAIQSGLVISTSTLPAGITTVPYSSALSAIGGTSPYTWTISAGSLPAGLTLTNAGTLAGTPTSTTTATSNFTVQVKDSATPALTATQALSIVVNAATNLPTITVSLSGSTLSAQQPTVTVTSSTGYAADINGTLMVAFAPAGSVGDPSVQFVQSPSDSTASSPLRTLKFQIPKNTTSGTIFSGTTQTAAQTKLATGTTTGTITLTAASVSATDGTTFTPTVPAPITVNPTPPVISKVTVTSSTTSLSVAVTGYSTPRDMSSMTFHFAPTTGTTLSATDVTVDVSGAFTTWYNSAASAAFGTQFTVTVPFTFSGTAFPVAAVTVDMTNSKGKSSVSNPANP